MRCNSALLSFLAKERFTMIQKHAWRVHSKSSRYSYQITCGDLTLMTKNKLFTIHYSVHIIFGIRTLLFFFFCPPLGKVKKPDTSPCIIFYFYFASNSLHFWKVQKRNEYKSPCRFIFLLILHATY